MLLITYDLQKPHQDYANLIKAIEGYGNYAHILKSTWLIRTTKSAQQVYEELSPFLDTNDFIFVTGVDERNQQGWLPKKFWDWINGR